MLRLPPEILGQIFLLCPHRTASETPWTLSRVSRYWREVAIDTPKLWTFISINIDGIYTYNRTKSHPECGTPEEKPIYSPTMLSSALEWSAGLPLHVSILDVHREPWPTGIRCLFDILMPTRTRWKSLTLDRELDVLAGGDFLSRYGALTFPALETLHVSYSNHGTYVGDIQRHAPQLSALILFNCESLLWDKGDHSIWMKLTYLEMLDTKYIVLAVLRHCNQLETLVVGESYFNGGRNIAPVEIRSLRRLQIPIVGGRDDQDVLATYLILPNLAYLVIEDCEWDNSEHDFWCQHYMEMVERSGCTLQTIELDITNPKDVSIGRLLRMAPQLSRLIIRGPVFSWLFDQMASDSGSPLVPNLEHLSVLFGGISKELSIRAVAGISKEQSHYYSRPLGAILKAAKSLPRLQTLHIETLADVSGVDWISALEDLDMSTCIVKKDNVDRVEQLRILSDYLILVHRHREHEDVFYENTPVFEEIFRILENDPNLTKEEFRDSDLEERMKEISWESFAEGVQFDSRAERLLERLSPDV